MWWQTMEQDKQSLTNILVLKHKKDEFSAVDTCTTKKLPTKRKMFCWTQNNQLHQSLHSRPEHNNRWQLFSRCHINEERINEQMGPKTGQKVS